MEKEEIKEEQKTTVDKEKLKKYRTRVIIALVMEFLGPILFGAIGLLLLRSIVKNYFIYPVFAAIGILIEVAGIIFQCINAKQMKSINENFKNKFKFAKVIIAAIVILCISLSGFGIFQSKYSNTSDNIQQLENEFRAKYHFVSDDYSKDDFETEEDYEYYLEYKDKVSNLEQKQKTLLPISVGCGVVSMVSAQIVSIGTFIMSILYMSMLKNLIAEEERETVAQASGSLEVIGDGTNAVSFDGESNFDGWLFQYYGIKLLCLILNICTLTLAIPFTTCIKEKWRLKHTTYNGKRLYFDGNGVELIGKYILWMILTCITFGIYVFFLAKNVEKWKARHTHIEGVDAIGDGTYTGSSFVGFFLSVFCLVLNVCSLFILVPFTTVWKYRYRVNHRIYDGYKIKFDGNGLELIGKFILWILLSVITFGIYALFVILRIEKWKVHHTSIKAENLVALSNE